MATKSEVLEYAHCVKSEKPSISKDEMRQVLRENFIEGNDVLTAPTGWHFLRGLCLRLGVMSHI
jgi:hypothetical protein